MYENIDKYRLVEFVNEVLDSGQKRIECVPTKWVNYNFNLSKYICKFMPLSWLSIPDCKKTLETMIKDQKDPPENWISYAVIIRESTASYEEAMQLLQSITTEKVVCTTESDKSPQKTALTTKSLAENATKQQKKIADIIEMQDEISVLQSFEKLLEEETTNYSLELCEKETADTSRSCSSQQIMIDKKEQAMLNELMKLSEEWKSELEPSCSSQSFRQSTESDAVRTTCTEEKKRASTSEEDKNVYRNDTPAVNDKKLMQYICILKENVRQMKETIDKTEKMLQAVQNMLIEREPRIDQGAPHIDQEAPRIDQKAPHIDQETSHTKQEVTRIDQKASRIDQKAPRIDQKAPYINQEAPPIEQRTPPFDEKYKLTLPFDTYEKFNEFDRSIRENAEQEADFMQILLQQFANREDVNKNITQIIKKFITKDVAECFNPIKNMRGKYAFKDTYFCQRLQAMINIILPDESKNFDMYLRNTLLNIKYLPST